MCYLKNPQGKCPGGQRAASVQRADHILVLDDGKLVGDAPHAELLRSCEVYKEICLSQLSKEEVAKTL